MSDRGTVLRARAFAAQGLSPDLIAKVFLKEGESPRAAWRLAALMSQTEAAALYCATTSDSEARVTGKRISEWERWPGAGDGRPPELANLVVLARLYGCEARELVLESELEKLPPSERFALEGLSAAGLATARTGRTAVPAGAMPELDPLDFDSLLRFMAEQSQLSLDAERASVVSDTEVERAFNNVRGLARDHLSINSIELLKDTLREQSRVLALLASKPKLKHARDLRVLAGALDLLVADTAVSAGRFSEAMRLADLGHDHGAVADHPEVVSWARGVMGASILNWRDRSARALEALDEAFPEQMRNGDPQYFNSLALYRARTGDVQGAREALRQAADARGHDEGVKLLRDEIGGMFAYPLAKQAQVATVTFLELQDYAGAAETAETALREYARLPASERAFGNEASASIDLAHARIGTGHAEEAIRALGPVLELEPERRQAWIVRRAGALRAAALAMEKHWGAGAREAADVLGDFAHDAIAAKFNSIVARYNEGES